MLSISNSFNIKLLVFAQPRVALHLVQYFEEPSVQLSKNMKLWDDSHKHSKHIVPRFDVNWSCQYFTEYVHGARSLVDGLHFLRKKVTLVKKGYKGITTDLLR
jgi:hypothetical protein